MSAPEGPVHTGCRAPSNRHTQILEHISSIGVFTQVASNIKGFACKFAWKSACVSCVNRALGGICSQWVSFRSTHGRLQVRCVMSGMCVSLVLAMGRNFLFSSELYPLSFPHIGRPSDNGTSGYIQLNHNLPA